MLDTPNDLSKGMTFAAMSNESNERLFIFYNIEIAMLNAL